MNADDIKEFEDQIKQEELFHNNQSELADKEKYRTDPDGTVFEFDPVKKAWFPKIDEDFIANYQYNYGIIPYSAEASYNPHNNAIDVDQSCWDNPPNDIHSEEYKVWYDRYMNYFYPSNNPIENNMEDDGQLNEGRTINQSDSSKPTAKRKTQMVEEAHWFDVADEKNTHVFVSDLPSDITEDSFQEIMKKVGLLAHDPILKKPKFKMYKDAEGNFTGNARCCYLKTESVDLALKILDGYDVDGKKIKVERAIFQLKGDYDPTKRRRKLTKQEKKRILEKQDKLLGWQPEKCHLGRPKHERVVILKHVFTPKEFEDDPAMMDDVSTDIREECKKFGETKKIIIYDRNDDGVVTVCFRNPEEADLCISALNGRYFAGRQLEAANWDGKTKYLVNETEAEMDARLKKWYSYLEKEPTQNAGTSTGTNTLPSTVQMSSTIAHTAASLIPTTTPLYTVATTLALDTNSNITNNESI